MTDRRLIEWIALSVFLVGFLLSTPAVAIMGSARRMVADDV